ACRHRAGSPPRIRHREAPALPSTSRRSRNRRRHDPPRPAALQTCLTLCTTVPEELKASDNSCRPVAGRRVAHTMRTLLIDNYDSFTYNLYQLISEVNGTEPTVVRNDEFTDIAALGLADYDNIVISPGPGRPDRPRDVGLSAAVIAAATQPLLGVCLGHQALVVAAGGRFERAPRPRHGYLDRVAHDGRDLFAGLPQDFTAVRYHSLAALRPLPACLEITARTGDGVIMGVR